jgi:hypothetical protein
MASRPIHDQSVYNRITGEKLTVVKVLGTGVLIADDTRTRSLELSWDEYERDYTTDVGEVESPQEAGEVEVPTVEAGETELKEEPVGEPEGGEPEGEPNGEEE